jgi:hypothetical protein
MPPLPSSMISKEKSERNAVPRVRDARVQPVIFASPRHVGDEQTDSNPAG